ncbi:MAG: transporter substrate-binding domain-containing protein [Desulfatitalea sp.]|nr:transporter substrate-binding domain-containing protein [Desulfatitalea sp.]
MNFLIQRRTFVASVALALICGYIFIAAYGAAAFADEAAATPGTPIQAGTEIAYPPFSIVDEAGRASGFSVELLRAAAAAMGREVTFRTSAWAEVRGWLERGEIDALPVVGRTPEREAIFDFTFPYMSLHGAIVVREGAQGIRSLADLQGRQVAVMQGDNAEEFLRREDRGIQIHLAATFEEALQELSQGRHDAVVIQRLTALRLIREAGIDNLRVINQPIEGFRQDFCFAVRKGDSTTLALLNEGLALMMADGTYSHLHAKWFAALGLPTERLIVFGGDHNYPPYEYLDDNGLPAGYNVDLTRAIAQAVGLDIEIRLGPWSDIREAMARGEIDALQGLLYSRERDRTFDFTAPHSVNHYVSVVRKDEMAPPATIADLTGLRIVVQRGDIMHDFAEENGLGASLVLVDAQEDALRALAQGEHDTALVSRLAAYYWIKRQGWRNLTVGREPFLSPGYCFAVPQGQQALLAQLGEGLKVLEETGEYRRIYKKWMGVFDPPAPPAFLTILRYVAMIAGPLLVLLSATALWSWSLRKQVARQTRELQESVDRFRYVFEAANVGKTITQPTGQISANQAFADFLGYAPDELEGKRWQDLTPADDQSAGRAKISALMAGMEQAARFEQRYIHKNGAFLWGDVSTVVRRDADGEALYFVTTIVDITERKRGEADRERLQSQLIQAQRMESVGRLAGGVAHDFNNMLSVIIGYSELALDKVSARDPLHDDLKEIFSAARRATDITRQLLAFARRQTIRPRVLDLNVTLERMLKMLRRLIGEDIDLSWRPKAGLGAVKMDPSQLDQLLANLCVNARDAIQGVGKITIGTDNVRFDEEYCAHHPDFVVGDFVLLAVSDDGCGMDAKTLETIFEPFFTTKGVGEGTGLGLATVYGIVKQNDGFINVYSEPGKGTTFRIYLPRHAGAAHQAPEPGKAHIPPGQGETVLIVEDETSILKLAQTLLERIGYTVLAASTPERAIALAESHEGGIHLLITDVVMPDMHGRELAERMQARYPDLKVLFMSGYTADVIAHRGVLDAGVQFLQKPFSIQALAVKVRQVLAQ